MTRTALEIIGQAGLGYSFDTLTDADEGSPYATAVKELLYVYQIYFACRANGQAAPQKHLYYLQRRIFFLRL